MLAGHGSEVGPAVSGRRAVDRPVLPPASLACGHRVLGRELGRRDRQRGAGYAYLHHVVDDHSRLAYCEILTDERKETAGSTGLHHDNHHRPHTGIGGAVPSDRVHNLTGNYS